MTSCGNRDFKVDVLTTLSQKSDEHFRNLNLNAKTECQNISNYKSIDTSGDNFGKKNLRFDYDKDDSGKRKNHKCFDNKIKSLEFTNIYSPSEEEKQKESLNSEILSRNSSTLSLHIAAYENSNDSQTDLQNVKQIKLGKTWKDDKQFFNAIHNQQLFEFPRQQQEKGNKPEIMQFKASQKLLNPNTPIGKSKITANKTMVQTDKNGSKMLVQTASEFYEKEEAIAKTFTNDKIMKDSYELFQKYRNVVQDHLQKDIPFNKNDVIHLQALVAQLRGLNRRSNLRTKLKSDTVEVKRKEVEKKHLTMQNLEMELEHLHRSIDDLKAVEFTHIDLVSSEECMQQKGISIETFNEMTEHDQQMALLSLELELRKELVKNIETMKSQVVEKEQKLEEKERKLDALLPQVNQIRKLTQPILTSLELHTVTTAHLERTNRSRYLAPQLSSLYVNVTVYNKVNEGSTLKFTCTGKIEEAIAFEQTQKEENNLKRQKSHIDEPTEMIVSEDEEESENEELMDIDRMPDSRTHREKEEEILNDFKKKQKLFTPHPISFTTSIPIPGDEAHSSNLVFNYLPQLDVVTVKPVIKLKPSFEPFMSAETILDEIYPGDSGQDLFNTSAAMLLSIAGAKIDEISSTLGRPYKFAQQFCLVPDEKENDECRHDRFKYFLKTMLRIGDRIKARSVLDVTCRNATALKPLDSLPEDFKKLIPTRGVCALTSFKSIKSEEVLSTDLLSSRQQLIISKLSESGQLQNGFQFIAGISHDGNDRVYALIHIPRAYPENGSSSMILLVPANEEKFEYMAGLEALETYLNIEVPKLAEKEPELMFAFQLALLATRCEVVHDVSERDTNLQYKPVNFYLNYHSSRIHQPIFDFVPSRNAYGHTVTKAKPT